MKMLAEDFNDNADIKKPFKNPLNDSLNEKPTDKPDKFSESMNSMSLDDVKKYLVKPSNTCIVDQDGFIACGPIVGVERPRDPIILERPRLDDVNPPKSKGLFDDAIKLPYKWPTEKPLPNTKGLGDNYQNLKH